MRFNVKLVGDRGKGWMIRLLLTAAVVSTAICILAAATDVFTPPRDYADLILYEGPKPVSSSGTVRMTVDGHELFVYETAVNNGHTWDNRYDPPLSTAPVASFDFADGAVTLSITVVEQTDLGEVVVRPLQRGVVPTVEGNTVRLQIREPDVYTVEWGGSAVNAMHIFANAIDPEAPTASTDTVRYIGPGAWSIDTMVLEDDMEVYISGGAVIRGIMMGKGVSNVKVSGHGFFDGSHNDSWMLSSRTAYVPVSLNDCENVDISGIALLDPNAWCMELYDCDSIRVDGVKIISARPNGDGISVQSSRDVTVTDSFIRSWDDSLVVKNYSNEKGSDSANITFDGCQIWTDLAQSMEVGYETNKGGKLKPTIQNVIFRNITVLHNFHKPVMSIHNADDAAVSGILFENIVVEDASMGKGDAGNNAQLIDIAVVQNSWSSTKSRGTVSDVRFDGIYVLDGDDSIDFKEGNFCPIRIRGFDGEHLCTGITVEDLHIRGEGVTDENVTDNPDTSIDLFTEDVRFICTGPVPEEIAALVAKSAG